MKKLLKVSLRLHDGRVNRGPWYELPTFYLDADALNLEDNRQAEAFVRQMFRRIGHSVAGLSIRLADESADEDVA
jgi:hypothetical protein